MGSVMGDKEKQKKQKKKDECCEKYIRKGRHCKDCPMKGKCALTDKD